MTRRPLLTLLAVALTIAASVFLGALLAILVAFRLLLPDPATANSGDLGRGFGIAASRSAQQADSPVPSGEMTTERQITLPSPDFAGRTGVSELAAASRAVPTAAPTPSVPERLRAGASASKASMTGRTVSGIATWYCLPGVSPCTAGYPATGKYAAVGPALRAALGDWRGRTVTVSAGGRSVKDVVLVDWCACPGADIDLYAGVFAALAPLDRGRTTVIVDYLP